MNLTITPQIKAQAIAAAIYTTTGIQPEVLSRPGKPPKIFFSKENAEKLRAYAFATLKKKSDIDVDIVSILRPVILKDVFPYLIIASLGMFLSGYLMGQAH